MNRRIKDISKKRKEWFQLITEDRSNWKKNEDKGKKYGLLP